MFLQVSVHRRVRSHVLFGVGISGARSLLGVGVGMSKGWALTPSSDMRPQGEGNEYPPTHQAETLATMGDGWQAGGTHPTGMLSC